MSKGPPPEVRGAKRSHRSKFPLESFDPRFKELLMQAATSSQTIEVLFETKKEAQAFQARAQTYRAKAQKAGLPEADIMYRVRISRWDHEDGRSTLRFVRQDSQFDDVFKRAGLGPAPETLLKRDPLEDL